MPGRAEASPAHPGTSICTCLLGSYGRLVGSSLWVIEICPTSRGELIVSFPPGLALPNSTSPWHCRPRCREPGLRQRRRVVRNPAKRQRAPVHPHHDARLSGRLAPGSAARVAARRSTRSARRQAGLRPAGLTVVGRAIVRSRTVALLPPGLEPGPRKEAQEAIQSVCLESAAEYLREGIDPSRRPAGAMCRTAHLFALS